MRATGEREGARVVLLEAIRLFPYELPPVEQLIQSAVEDRDPDYAISLLKAHQSLFVEKGASTFLERTYLSLLELMPEEKRLKLGLKELYKAAGEEAKPSGISEEMEGVEEEEEPEELELDLSEELSLSTEEG